MDNLQIAIRKLAKRIEQQNIFSTCKELQCLKLFDNDKDLSRLQHLYLSYLFFYYNLNMNVALKKVSEKVLDNMIYEDAYAVYEREKKEDSPKKREKDIHLVFKKSKSKKRKK
jgi:hypothetical protein